MRCIFSDAASPSPRSDNETFFFSSSVLDVVVSVTAEMYREPRSPSDDFDAAVRSRHLVLPASVVNCSTTNPSSWPRASRRAPRTPMLSQDRYPPWLAFRLIWPVPATDEATQTCRTSCGSAVSGTFSTMFSSGLANTLPCASEDRTVGGAVGRTTIVGPDMSVAASGVVQVVSSSGSWVEEGSPEVEMSAEDDS